MAEIRRRLGDLGWFMKCLKEPLARIANQEDGCTGAFWEGRYKSIAVMDEEGLLATAAYIDLNPVAAGIATTPEDSAHTSLRARITHCQANGTAETLRDDLALITRNSAQEAGLWLLPVDDDRAHGGERAGLYEGLTLSCYLRIIDASNRMIRAGKASLEADMAPIFQRLGLDQDLLESTVAGLFRPRQRVSNHRGCKQQPARAINFLLTAELEASRRSDHFSVPAEFSPLVLTSTIGRSDPLAEKPAIASSRSS